jgi:adenylate cyclase
LVKLGVWARVRRYLPLMTLTLSATTFFLGHAAGAWTWGFLDRLENIAYDARMLLSMPETVDDSIVIVDIDEKSLAEEGRWPWGRDRLARLVLQLVDYYKVAVVGFDVVFPEADDSSGLRILEQLGKVVFQDVPEFQERLDDLRDELDYDRLFANSLTGRPVLLGYFFTVGARDSDVIRTGVLPPPVFPAGAFEGMAFFPPTATGFGANRPEFYETAAGHGHFTPAFDDDGTIRRVPMLYQYDGAYYEALSLAMVRFILGVDKLTADFLGGPSFERDYYSTPERIRVGPLDIPIDERSQVLVPYRGYQGSFPYVSATDVLGGRVDPAVLDGRIVLVGTSAQGHADLRTTPVQVAFPGVEIHANVISGVLEQRIRERPAYVVGLEFVLLLATGVLLMLLLPGISAIAATLSTLLVLASFVALNFYMWEMQNLVVPLAPGTMMILIIFLLSMSYGFFVEGRGKRQLSSLFGQYVPPELVDEMNIDPEAYTQDAQSRDLTVLFSDVRGFTTLSEGLTPGQLSALMNEYLTPMTAIIHEHRGTIDKYMGDAIMAFWGAPIADPDHARHAVQAGLAMIERLDALGDEFEDRGWPRIRIGVGINTGMMSVGDMGSEFRMAYTVLGDAVNLGSRLEGLTKNYGVDVIVSESTKAAVPEYIYRELDVVRVKGKEEPIGIFEPVASGAEIAPEELAELDTYEEALQCYRNQEWQRAAVMFAALLESDPDRKIYRIYLERIEAFREHPPGADWDGVFTHTTK